jgi:ubiquitin-conjugating enzyme E2 S
MMTRIFHPNVSKAGEICVDTLKKSWNKKYGVGHVLVVSLIQRSERRANV